MTPHNERLHQEMLDAGHEFRRTDKYESFYDSNGNYVSYPAGYIRGPSYNDNGNQKPWYCSVQSPNGWHQRCFINAQDAREWAIQKQNELLEERIES